MRRALFLLAAAAVVASPAQAAPPPPAAPVAWDAGPEPFQGRLAAEGERNRVLNQMEIGARAFWRADYPTAKAALDDAIAKIGAVFANDPNAAKARQVWYDEGSKDFKGEPYERAMVFAYRGLAYLADGDYENARAAFRQGQMQDAFAEEQQNRTDFALLIYLEAWASHVNRDFDLRDEALALLGRLRTDLPPIGKDDDTLVLAETGFAPRKLGDGLDHSFFVYRRGRDIAENEVEIVRNGEPEKAYPLEDIYFQASTRGGRPVDKILQGKAKLKQNTGTAGSVLADTSVAIADFGGVSDATAAVGAVSAVLLMVSSKAKPQADVRTWASLPDTVHVMTFASKGKPPALSARFLKDGAPAAGAEKPVRCETDENRKTLCLVRAH
jgi:tetratricopeptide (TPR) repeat protein